jgi:putative nucleotidyltransferase with HDIG domain
MGIDIMTNRVNEIIKNERYQLCLKKISEYEMERVFCRHDMDHFLSVARIMLIKSLEDHIPIDKETIYAVALLHDIGRVLQYEKGQNHAKAGEQIAKEILQECGYQEDEIEAISNAIVMHNDQQGNHQLCSLLQYADKISRNCFLCPALQECNWPEEKKNRGVIV